MSTADVLATHRLQVDWTNETVACSCGWHDSDAYTGVPPEQEWQDHMVRQFDAMLEGPDTCPTCHTTTGFIVPGRGSNEDAFISDER